MNDPDDGRGYACVGLAGGVCGTSVPPSQFCKCEGALKEKLKELETADHCPSLFLKWRVMLVIIRRKMSGCPLISLVHHGVDVQSGGQGGQ